MSVSFTAKLPSLIIPAGQTKSNFITSTMMEDAVGLMLFSHPDNPVNARIQISNYTNPTSDSDWYNFTPDGTPITTPAPGNAYLYAYLTCSAALRLVIDSTESDAVEVAVLKSWTV
jgi:hypothetical protein